MQFRSLADILPGVPAMDAPIDIAQGATARVLAIGQDHVLKLFTDGAADSMIEREAVASRLAQQSGLPTAGALGLIRYAGARGILFPRVAGVTMQAELRRRPLNAGALFSNWMQLCSDMHAVRSTALRSFKDVCRTDLVFGPLPDETKRQAIAYLDALPDGDRLLHGDLHVGNVILSPDGMVLIDWSKAAMGDPIADIARMDMLMRFGIGPRGLAMGLWRDWAARTSSANYLNVTGGKAASLASWRPIVALTWLRVGLPMRTRPFLRYANQALNYVGLPKIEPALLRWRAS